MYALQKYAGARTRHKCPACGRERCFSLYVDEHGQILDETVGRCDHTNTCGYHLKPREFFAEHPDAQARASWQPKAKPLCTIPDEQVRRFRSNENSLYRFLVSVFGDRVDAAFDAYQVGALATGETVFWQIDQQFRPRSAKLIKYGDDGHRMKGDGCEVGWLHSRLKRDGLLPPEWELTQCLFGEHLLQVYPDKEIALVESEKTALIGAIYYPKDLWLATGGKNNLTADRLGALYGRRVMVYPDADAFEDWAQKVANMAGIYNVRVWETTDYDNPYTEEQINNKNDIADLILKEYENRRNKTNA